MSKENKKFKKSNESLMENDTDLKCRSMRDNIIFLGTSEMSTPMEADDKCDDEIHSDSSQARARSQGSFTSPRRSDTQVAAAGEDCVLKVFEFCEKTLKIPRPGMSFNIDPAHRIGGPAPGKVRPIVVKFKDTESKQRIKNALKDVDLKGTNHAVFDQLPKEVQE